jgi:hypothetical protein
LETIINYLRSKKEELESNMGREKEKAGLGN